eukprot:scaffold1354_cov112-Cylindrotheca_fusiformis.AAC.3
MATLNDLTKVARRSIKNLRFPQRNRAISTCSERHISPYQSSSAVHVFKRNMVMVTQTKSSGLPEENQDTSKNEPTASIDSLDQLSDSLIVTPSCLKRVQALIEQRRSKNTEESSNDFLRVFVDAGGCSGFQYQFEFDDELDEEEDIVVVADEESMPRIVVDNISLGFIKGSKLDYVQEMIKSSFVIAENPQSESACGCGSSFAVKNFEANPALD